ncbi:MAG: hypothetical protein KDE15_00845 [Erythrobacter sp.]|nr:hypothetical protein [Erythrobacter sp.]
MRGKMIAVAALLGATVPAQAQPVMSEGQVALHAEMWAMAGICGQFSQYNVRERRLADYLNATMARLDPEQQDALVNGRSARQQAISARVAQANATAAGPRRSQAQEANTEELMTRCQQLVRDDLAGEYFQTRRN